MDFSEIVQHLENLKLTPNKMGEFAVNGECIIYEKMVMIVRNMMSWEC